MTQPPPRARALQFSANSGRVLGLSVLFFGIAVCGSAQTNVISRSVTNNLLEVIQGRVEVARRGTETWTAGQLHQILYGGDRVRTGERSRAEVYLANGMTIRKGEFTEFEIPPSPGSTFKRGLFYLLNREKTKGSEFRLPSSTAAIRGTDFLVQVDGEHAEVTVLDGEVVLTNPLGEVVLTNREVGIVDIGVAPRKTALLAAVNNVIQWSLYYPAILDLDELEFTAEEKQALSASFAAYRSGELLQAIAQYPWDRVPTSDAERVFRIALLLAVGKVDQAALLLQSVQNQVPAARAFEQLIAATKFQVWVRSSAPRLATEWLAESYYQQSLTQSRTNLDAALNAAREATKTSPNFGVAWSRVAELEFSFGRTKAALTALETSLQLSPRNPQSLALKGLLLAAQNKISAAISMFEEAIEIDSGLPTAWLGHGLCLIRRGDIEAGQRDLFIAASLEPQRAVYRSYLGKAFTQLGDFQHAAKELGLAISLDPNDPTAWLYSALLNEQRNRINASILDLEKSRELNDNRNLFRSRLLLDQDRAVRSANLAAIYRDAGMFDVSVRESSRAVVSDYANYSAHLFLANSYAELSDPNLVTLRYETATFSEYLLANLLAPVGASTLSQQVSQQEYSKLFERDRFGVSSSTTYLSNGDWQQEGSQFGTFGNTAYALDGIYRSFNGQRHNNDLEQFVFSAQVKEQLTAQDSIYFQAIYNNFQSGDLRQFYNFDNSTNYNLPRPSARLRVREQQEPNIFAGYHHEWSPGSHTLFLAGRLNDTLNLREPSDVVVRLNKNDSGEVIRVPPPDVFDLNYKNRLDAYSAELQQIWQIPKHIVIAGARFQAGDVDTRANFEHSGFPPIFDDPAAAQKNSADLERANVYAYYNWQVVDPLWLSAGVSYDRLDFPQNVSSPPISSSQAEKDRVSPKAGFTWTPEDSTTIRGAYTRSLGGLFYDQSVRLEPTQIAGFNQAFRSLFPESLVGPVPGSEFETFQLGLDHRFKTQTYVVLEAALLKAEANRAVGVFDYFPSGNENASPSQTRQKLDYKEPSFTVTLNQLLGNCWSIGSRYRLSHSELETHLPQVPSDLISSTDNRAVLHQLNFFGIYNHPKGFFAEAQALWWAQQNHGYTPELRDDDFWQFNLFGGYRFPRRHGQVLLGLANITGQNYRLNPLSVYGELPRDRTLVVSFRFDF